LPARIPIRLCIIGDRDVADVRKIPRLTTHRRVANHSFTMNNRQLLDYLKKGPNEFFDSLGRAPERYHERFRNILKVNGPDYELCSDSLQADGSNVCGHYCIYFVVRRYSGVRIKTLLKRFTIIDRPSNDDVAYTFVQNL
jgi:hypothetical protein